MKQAASLQEPEIDPMTIQIQAAKWERLPDKMIRQLLIKLTKNSIKSDSVQGFSDTADKQRHLYWALDVSSQTPLPIARSISALI